MAAMRLPAEPHTIEGIMEELGEQFNRASTATVSSVGSPPEPLDGGADADREMESLLRRAEQAKWIRPEARIPSHRPILGLLINPIKRFAYWAVRPHLDRLTENQERFNESILRAERALWQRSRPVHRQHSLDAFFDSIPSEKRLAMMDRCRGPESEIQARQVGYLDYFRGRPGHVLDVGCGRGEFLSLLRQEGIEAWGCETDQLMMETCAELSVHVRKMTALSALHSVPPGSLGGVFAAQVIEHMFPGELLSFLKLARQSIAPGGVIVLETLNPQSLGVLSKSYYKDLEHKQLIDPDYLVELLELIEFENVTVHRTMPFTDEEKISDLPSAETMGVSETGREALQSVVKKLNDAIWGPQDFFIVAEVLDSPSATEPSSANPS